jgi:nucleoside-diphosphate kinase
MSQLHPEVTKVRFERTFCMIKPDGVMRGVVGDIISRIERAGLKIVAMKMILPTEEQVRAHYPVSDEAWVTRLGQKSMSSFQDLTVSAEEVLGTTDELEIGKEVVGNLVQFMTSGPVICMVVEGVQAVAMMRKLAGATLPFMAAVGTIRGDYSVDSPAVANAQHRSIHNLFHASETIEEVQQEIAVWFDGETIQDYKLSNEATLYGKFY